MRFAPAVSLALSLAVTFGAVAGSSADTTQPPISASPVPSLAVAAGEQVQFILEKQLPSGAIQKEDGHIEPYAANTAALGLLSVDTDETAAAVLKWMQWTLTHLNIGTDPDGLEYTISNWVVVDGVESPVTGPRPYDSVDSYAATSLTVAAAAYESGRSDLMDFVSSNIHTYEAIANLLTYAAPNGVRMPNGLTRAVGHFSSEYTMDNAEVYAGLRAFGELELALGRAQPEYNYYDIWAETTRHAMQTHLYNEDQGWDLGTGTPGNGSFYETGMPNYFPVLFGVTAPIDPKSIQAWMRIDEEWPLWSERETKTCAPATSLAAAATKLGHEDQAMTLLRNTVDVFAADNWSYPNHCPEGTSNIGAYWHTGEAGWFLLTAKGLGIQPQFPATD